MQIAPLELIVIIAATWHLAQLVTSEAGPYDALTRFRQRYALGGLTTCIKCFSPWAGAIVLFLWIIGLNGVVWILGISGAALMLRAYTGAGMHD